MATIEELKASKHWVKPWGHLTKEEKSFIVLKAYERRVLNTEDIDSYSTLGTRKQRVNMAFPWVLGGSLYLLAPKIMRLHRLKPTQQAGAIVFPALALWLAFQYTNPL